MKNKTSALLFVLASSVLILAGCGGKTAASSTTTDASSTATSKSTPTSTPASSTTPASSEPVSSESTSSTSSEDTSKLDIAYADDTFGFGGAGDAGTGKFVYWAGDGGTVSAHSKTDGVYSLTYASAGQWYGIQAFYKLPYAESGDTYKVSWSMNSDVAGDITINDTVHTLVAGDNVVNFDVAQGVGNTISLQLGASKTSSKLAGSSFKFSVPVVYDTTANAKYNEVKFVSGTTTVKDIQVKNGKMVSAPADPTPETGYLFDGWFNGTAEFDATAAVNAAATYTAKFVSESEATKYTVTFMNGTESMGTLQVIKGKKIVVPSLAYPFGNTAMGWYKEAALTNAWNLDTDTVTADVTLYVKLKVTPSATFMNTGDTGYKIPDANLTNNDDGSLKVSGFAGWGQAAWVVQVNFAPVPATDATKTYTVAFKYKINAAGADVQVYDGATIGTAVTMAVATDWTDAAITFTGHVCTSASKLTFELGAIASTVTSVELQISALTLTVA